MALSGFLSFTQFLPHKIPDPFLHTVFMGTVSWGQKAEKNYASRAQFYLFFPEVTPGVHGCQDTEFLPSSQQLYLIILVL